MQDKDQEIKKIEKRISEAYQDLEIDARDHGSMGQGYINDYISALWRTLDKLKES